MAEETDNWSGDGSFLEDLLLYVIPLKEQTPTYSAVQQREMYRYVEQIKYPRSN